MSATTLLTGGAGPDGAALALRVDPAAGTILEAAPSLTAHAGETVHDCAGLVLLPAPCEPHAHLDKALSGGRAPNPAGDLAGAIEAWHRLWPTLTRADLLARARAAAHELVAHGTTHIRSHVDLGPGIGMLAVETLLALREELAREGLATLQVCALVSTPLSGGAESAERRALLDAAIAAGIDLVGGVPHLDPDPPACTRLLVEAAARAGLPLDLHTDETLDAGVLWLRDLIRLTAEHGLGGRVAASHCVSLGVQPQDVQRAVAEEAAAAGVAVITLPQTNLYLQARDRPVAPPRGLAPLRVLLDAGVTVAAGADNVRDPFCSMGRSDALETAALLVMTAHLTPEEAWHAVAGAARAAMGLPPVALAAGAPADVLAVRGSSLTDAIARGSEDRLVLHAGRVVARTTVASTLATSVPDPRPLAAGAR